MSADGESEARRRFTEWMPRLERCARNYARRAQRPTSADEWVNSVYVTLFGDQKWTLWRASGYAFGYLRVMVANAYRADLRLGDRDAPLTSVLLDELPKPSIHESDRMPSMPLDVAPTRPPRPESRDALLRAVREAMRNLSPVNAQLLHMSKVMELSGQLIRCLLEASTPIERRVPRLVRRVRRDALAMLGCPPDERLVRRPPSRRGERARRAETQVLLQRVVRGPWPKLPAEWDELPLALRDRATRRAPPAPERAPMHPPVAPEPATSPALWTMPTEETQRIALAAFFEAVGPTRPRAMRVFHLTLMYGDRAFIEQSIEIKRPGEFDRQRAAVSHAVNAWLEALGLGQLATYWLHLEGSFDER